MIKRDKLGRFVSTKRVTNKKATAKKTAKASVKKTTKTSMKKTK